MDDSIPIVLDPDDPHFTDPAINATASAADVLSRVMARSAAALPRTAPMCDYLRSIGLTDPAVWATFRLGAGGETLAEGFSPADWTAITAFGVVHRTHGTLTIARPGGINVPTCDPREPDRVLGVVRLAPSQHKHSFLTPPRGIACAPDLAQHPQIVLADTHLGLRLAQHGVPGVALVEDVAVLADLLDVCAGRKVVITSTQPARLAALRAALGPYAAQAASAQVHIDVARSSAESLNLLGLDRGRLRAPPAPRPPITLQLLDRLHRHALGNVQRGEGAHALRTAGITDATFAAVFQVGYLRPDIRMALTPDDRRALEGFKLGGTVVVPARDEHNVIVDLLIIRAEASCHVTATLFDRPRGLLGAPVITAYDAIRVTDRLSRAARYAQEGCRNVIVLRDGHDAAANVTRLAKAGVRRAELHCWRGADDIATVLAAAGIETVVARVGRTSDAPVDAVASDVSEVLPGGSSQPVAPLQFPARDPAVPATTISAPPPTSSANLPMTQASPVAVPAPDLVDVPILEDHDPQSETAVFRAGDLAYAIQVPWDDRTTIQIRASRADHQHVGEVDVAVDNQRRRFAIVTADRLDVPAQRIARHLVSIHAALPGLITSSGRTKAHAPIPAALGASDQAEIQALLRAPDLLDQMVRMLGTLGWHGEDELKRLLILVALSRKLDVPAWAVMTAAHIPGPPIALHTIAAATPPEDCILATRLTDNALLHADPDALRHRLLIIDDLDRVTAAVSTHLRVLRARGGLSATLVERDPLHGAMRTRFIQARGPVAVLGAAMAGKIQDRLALCFAEVNVDESPDQIAAVLATERHRRADPIATGRSATQVLAATHRLHALQRLVEPRPVVVPDIDAMAPRPGSPRARRDQETFLALASASALLHQHQRLSENGCVIATAVDVSLAHRLTGLWAQDTEGGLSRTAAQVLAAVRAADQHRFTMNDLAALMPGHDRHVYRAALDELIRTEYLTAPTGGRGRLRQYHLLTASEKGTDRTESAYPVRHVGELANPKTNFPPTLTPDERVG